MMPCHERFTNRVTRCVLEIRSPHFYARPELTKKIGPRISWYGPSNPVGKLLRFYSLLFCIMFQMTAPAPAPVPVAAGGIGDLFSIAGAMTTATGFVPPKTVSFVTFLFIAVSGTITLSST